MKKIIILLLSISIFFVPRVSALEASSPTWLLVDVASGRVLAGSQIDTRIFPASTTKVLTALVLLEYADPHDYVTVGPEISMVGWDSSTARLADGDILTVTDLVMAMMLPSGNDAAYTAAVYTARRATGNPSLSPEEALGQFAMLMNEKAWSLGAIDSNFVTPCGYHNPQHYSTARDIALISLAALEVPLIRRSAATREYSTHITTSTGTASRNWQNTNQLLLPDSPHYYSDAIGFKTGRTVEAGFCLVSLARRNGQEAMVLIFGGSRDGRWQDTKAIFEHYFSEYQVKSLAQAEASLVQWGGLEVGADRDLALALSLQEASAVTMEFVPDSALAGKRGPKPPITQSQVVGILQWWVGSELVAEVPAVALNNLPKPFYLQPLGIALIILPLLVFYLMARSRRRKRTVSRRLTYYRTR